MYRPARLESLLQGRKISRNILRLAGRRRRAAGLSRRVLPQQHTRRLLPERKKNYNKIELVVLNDYKVTKWQPHLLTIHNLWWYWWCKTNWPKVNFWNFKYHKQIIIKKKLNKSTFISSSIFVSISSVNRLMLNSKIYSSRLYSCLALSIIFGWRWGCLIW